MYKLLIILLLALPVYQQTPVAESKGIKYYLYPDTVYRIENKVIFTAKWQSSREMELSSVFAHCNNRTYFILSSMKKKGKKVDYYTYKQPKTVQPIKNSAMWIMLDLICYGK